MITIKIKIDDELQDFAIPTNHGDLIYKRYAEIKDADLQKKSLDERMSARTGLEQEIFTLLPMDQISRLMTLTEFADEDIQIFEQSQKTMAKVRKMNIARDTFGKLEKARQIIQKSERGYFTAMIDVIKLYTEQDIGDRLTVKVYAYVHEFTTQFEAFLKKYERLTEYEPTDEELEAGIEILKNFGSFPTIVSLARSLKLTYNEVLQMSADEVYMTLLYDFEENQIKKKLSDIHQRDAALQAKAKGKK